MALNLDAVPTVLADGTSFEELINPDDHTISLRLFTDPEIYRWELERVFTRSWIVLAHESEVPNPGDYVSRSIGQDPVIVSRDEDGKVHVLLNVCAHRGMQVCRAEYGHTSTFRCPYHGWIYGLDGSLRGLPAKNEIYGDRLDKDDFGLVEARVEVYAGMVWATWDARTPELFDYLGDFKFYLDVAFNRSDLGMEVVGPPQRWVMPANWKFAADQFAGDGYHVVTLHRSMKDIGLLGSIEDMKQILYGVDVGFPEGHGLRCLPTNWRGLQLDSDSKNGSSNGSELSIREKLAYVVPAGLTREMIDEPLRLLTPDQLRLLTDFPPIVGQIFPTAAWINDGSLLDGALKPSAAISWRTWIPRGPGEMEVLYWSMVEKGAPESHKDAMRKAAIQVFTSSGLIDQDDAEVWSGTQRVIGGVMAQAQRSTYHGLLGEIKPDGWPGGGLVYDGPSADDNQWLWWMRYSDFMTNKVW